MKTAKIYYKGKGEHSVNELETLCEQNKDEISSLKAALYMCKDYFYTTFEGKGNTDYFDIGRIEKALGI
jgi:hypothetical protein